MMDVVNDPNIETAVYMIASQLGKTASELNTLWYFVDQDPSPILFVMPSEKNAEDLSKERIATAIRDTPKITPLFGSPRTRDTNNTLLNKQFPGGFLALAGANAPRGLASRPVRILIMDEIDGYPASAGSEGDPITLAEARTTNFWNRKRLYSSTPSIKNASRIEKLYNESDQRKFFVPCPQCGEFQTIEWESLKWPSPKTGAARHLPEECYYVCVNGCSITEDDKPDMLRLGEWRATNPGGGDGKTAGFHLSVLYSPWMSWTAVIQDWLKKYRQPQLRKAFWNTRLARTFEIVGESVGDAALYARRILYEAEAPAGVLVITAGVDVQADRVECEVVGWGVEDESWSLDYIILRGNPALPELWAQLREILLDRRYRHENGARLRIASAFVDSGFHAKQVYKFVRPLQPRRIYACKGQSGTGVPLTKPRAQSRTHRARVDLRIVGIDAAKEALYANLKVETIGPGYCHFPSAFKNEQGVAIERKTFDKEYFEQLTAEKLITEMDGMTPVRKWVKKRDRNEVLDCRVYAMAALDDLNVNWKRLAKSMAKKVAEEPLAALPAPEKAAREPDDDIPVILGKPQPAQKSVANRKTRARDWNS
jgi:phage terminase large subunit GpA-like protein